MKNQIEIYKTPNETIEVNVQFDDDTVWLNQNQLVELFQKDKRTISEHINNIFNEGELERLATVRKFRTVQTEGNRDVTRNIEHYNLDIIISVGYRVKSIQGTRFRQWATKRLKDYLVEGFAVNEKRLAQHKQGMEELKTHIRIMARAIEYKSGEDGLEWLSLFSKGLELLDDYDHEELDSAGSSEIDVTYPEYDDYLDMIGEMYSDFESDVFAKPKDDSFHSSINQIRQSFDDKDLYPTLEEKAANLLYLIVKNHSFVDGNKRIAAACFLYFLEQNNMLMVDDRLLISNEALASLTLFIASSKADESEMVKRLVISILNRSWISAPLNDRMKKKPKASTKK